MIETLPNVEAVLKWHDRVREPLLTVLLAVQVFTLFIMPPLRAAGLNVPHLVVLAILSSFVALAIVLSRSRGAMVTLIVSFILTVVSTVWRNEQPDPITANLSVLGQLLTQISLFWVIWTAVFGPGRTSHHRILGGIVMYLCIGSIFTDLYIMLAQVVPNALTNLPADNFGLREMLTYFSFSTLTTGSFGDILPVHPMARSLANLESICGQLFPATLLARIVSLHLSHKTD